jgi:hypothetical protein
MMSKAGVGGEPMTTWEYQKLAPIAIAAAARSTIKK